MLQEDADAGKAERAIRVDLLKFMLNRRSF